MVLVHKMLTSYAVSVTVLLQTSTILDIKRKPNSTNLPKMLDQNQEESCKSTCCIPRRMPPYASIGCIAKQAVEAFPHLIKGKVDDGHGHTSTSKKGSSAAIESIGNLGRLYYGEYLSCQSDRDFRRTKFGIAILVAIQRRRAMDMLVS